ncbi:hypothetical protein PF002_g26758 [Phytophthora fragariae]|uniref:RXLR phytopathogen effector protein WY-domain domain-containing protein n=2 Tax=Phytophthora fragariae TaxID=53985 RepID=A0A6A3I286_9STRA|nr:hypothetical protein PF003_g31936 [Phytophthora fragariae]KAE8923045.1 hypothetical protein PF009_g26699 [Phytophthora fragariae]KAE8974484.1 hypothetical protein PF011_g24845 [Phytophthora fragariae]KAE9072910.1 hypothetical protein PF007_g26005 [Phytophthora fragariae]KAE9089505.1 hypothetical protein PF006_g25348 [Phytophthora fragariae]
MSKTNPEKVFTILRLGEAGAKLDDNPKFLQWLKYVEKYSNLQYRSYSNNKVFDLLRKTNSDEELVVLFQSLRRASGMEDVADSMQRILFLSSPSIHRLLNEAWLKSHETPVNVFNILRLGEPKAERNSMLLQWLKYTEMYRSTMGGDAFSTSKTYQFVLDAFPEKLPSQFAELFQLVKRTPDLKNLGGKMQNYLFKSLVDEKFTPETFRGQLGVPGVTPVFELRKDDSVYKALEDFTVFYTVERKL